MLNLLVGCVNGEVFGWSSCKKAWAGYFKRHTRGAELLALYRGISSASAREHIPQPIPGPSLGVIFESHVTFRANI